jgi:hypothetical protein
VLIDKTPTMAAVSVKFRPILFAVSIIDFSPRRKSQQ